MHLILSITKCYHYSFLLLFISLIYLSNIFNFTRKFMPIRVNINKRFTKKNNFSMCCFVFIISNNLLILSIQFLLSSYVIAKEYGELITYKLCIRNPNLVSNIKNGLLCNILFCLPIINIIAPVLTTVIITNKLIKERSL